jgi:hypothetical protein
VTFFHHQQSAGKVIPDPDNDLESFETNYFVRLTDAVFPVMAVFLVIPMLPSMKKRLQQDIKCKKRVQQVMRRAFQKNK